MTTILCDGCQFRDIVTEIRKNSVNKYPSCLYFHSWFGVVTNPDQCQDYMPEEDDGECE